MGVVLLAKVGQNVTLDPEVLDEFFRIAAKKGMKLSTWVNQQMKEFVEEEQRREAEKKAKGTP